MSLTKYIYDYSTLLNIVRNSQEPKYPEFTKFTSRLKTFDTYIPLFHDKFRLCEAGFKFLGAGDCMQCFNCGLILYKWTATDCPWKEHAFHSPKCTFVLLKKGSQFIDSAIQSKPKIECDCGCGPVRYDAVPYWL